MFRELKAFRQRLQKALFYLIINEVILLNLVVYFMMNDGAAGAAQEPGHPAAWHFLVYTYRQPKVASLSTDEERSIPILGGVPHPAFDHRLCRRRPLYSVRNNV